MNNENKIRSSLFITYFFKNGFVFSQSIVSFKVVEKSLIFTLSESSSKIKRSWFTGASENVGASSCLALSFLHSL